MKNLKKYIVKIIIMCIAFFLIVLCARLIKYENQSLEGRSSCQVITGVTTLMAGDMDTIQENMEYVEGCYSIRESQTVEGILEKTDTVTVVAESCDSNKIFPSFNVLYADDPYGCLLDKGTIYTLFGTSESVGQTVIYDDREYIVRGIIEEDVPVMVINYSDDDEMIDGIVVNSDDELYRGQYADKLASVYGISGNSYYFYDYKSITDIISMPGKWSDFSSWGDTADDIAAWFSHILYENKDVPEQLAVRMGYRYLLYYVVIVISAVCLIYNAVKCFLINFIKWSL